MVVYGGDEVQAITLDVGTSSTRAGYSGEDTPKCIIPSAYGVVNDSQYYFGHSGPAIYRTGQEVKNPVQDSVVQDWEAAERLIAYALNDGMRIKDLSEHPLLVTEPAWTPKENREKMIELAFEKFDAPAYYSVDRAVASAFAAGKGSALVVDIGEDSSSIVPIYDGFVINKSIKRSPLSASLLNSLIAQSLCLLRDPSKPTEPYAPTPQYLIKSKQPVEIGRPPVFSLREERVGQATPSFTRYAEQQLLHELKETVCEVSPVKWNDQFIQAKPPKIFEFPDGYAAPISASTRFGLPEVFFEPSRSLTPEIANAPQSPSNATIPLPPLASALGIPQLCREAVGASDADIQQLLMSNIVVVGGTTLLPGFSERLVAAMTEIAPGTKPKVSASGFSVERKHAAWLGGSILSSLGSFHQLWISKEEYQETGKAVVHKRAR